MKSRNFYLIRYDQYLNKEYYNRKIAQYLWAICIGELVLFDRVRYKLENIISDYQ